MTSSVDGLLWALRTEAHAHSYRLGHGDEVFWRAYALLQHPDWTAGCGVVPVALGPDWEELGRELSELHLHWHAVVGWPRAEPLPAEARAWRVLGVAVLDLAPDDAELAAKLERVALQTVRRLEELPPLPG